MNKRKTTDFETRFQKTHMYKQIAGFAKTNAHSYKTKDTYMRAVNYALREIHRLTYVQKIENITAKHIKYYINMELEKGKTIATLKKEMSAIRAICQYVENWYGGKKHIKFEVQDNKELGLDNKVFKPRLGLNKEQFKKLLQIIQQSNSQYKQEFKGMAIMQYYYGLRAEEATLVSYEQLEKAKKTGILKIKEGTKGGRERDVKILTKKQYKIIDYLLDEYKDKKRKYLFINKNEKGDNERKYNAYLAFYYQQRNKIQEIRPQNDYNEEDYISSHTLRHAYATNTYMLLRKNGKNHKKAWQETVEYLGHGKQRTELFRTYCYEAYAAKIHKK